MRPRKKVNFFKNTDIKRIYIQLGKGCNLRCKYCYHNNSDQVIEDNIYLNEDIFDFIKDCVENQDSPIELRFFGGEPLLYCDIVKRIVERTCNFPGISYSIITNGKTLDKKTVNFFNQHDFRVTLSWDGHKASKKYRGYDALDANKDNILAIKNLDILSTIVELTKVKVLFADLENVLNEYYNIHHKVFGVSWTIVEDMGTQEEYLDNAPFNDIYKEFTWLAKRIKNAILRPADEKKPADVMYESIMYKELQGAVDINFGDTRIIAGSDNPTTFTIDLSGNMYLMHRFYDASPYSVRICSIYDNYYVYMQKLLTSPEFEDQIVRNGCEFCNVRGICRGPGPLACEKTEKILCKNRRATFLPLTEIIEEICGDSWNDLFKEQP